ncbi:MAG: 30S ribosomal protein S8 [Candidatus Lightella neohaematopini]|nr:30S ribosomal protein S8 [Candidatus Lightella neohaematopini]MCV2528816.1 30S ribosomal protein S8 [Candidatus Lightella neohaematopini]
MSMHDPISDMIVRIRSGQQNKKHYINVPASNIKINIVNLLKIEGYINNFNVITIKNKNVIQIELKYFNNLPVIECIKRISKPSLRVYKKACDIPRIMSGMGIAIISTSKGIMTDRKARHLKLGGEIICYVF